MSQNTHQANEHSITDLKLLNMLGATTGAFAICYLAPAVVYFIGGGKKHILTPGMETFYGLSRTFSIQIIIDEMVFYHAPPLVGVILNPIIYGAMNSEYRGALMQLLRARCGSRKRNGMASSQSHQITMSEDL